MAYVDRITLTVAGRDLDDIIVEFSENRARKTSAVNTMNKSRVAKGFKRGNRMFSGTMRVEEIDDPSAPNWDDIMAKDLRLKVTKVPSAGKRVTFEELVVADISDQYSDGDSGRTLSWQALRRKVG